MTKLTLGQAAKHAQRSKGTISKALNNGNLTGEKITKNGRETWQIEPSELQRWMDANPLRNGEEVQNTTPIVNTENTIQNSVLEVKLQAAEQRYDDAQQTIEDLRARLDKSEAARERQDILLADLRPQQRKGFWARLRG